MLVVICHPDEPPHVEDTERLDVPDGMTGWTGLMKNNMPSLAIMPSNEMRPETETMLDYIQALMVARTYLRYGQLKDDNMCLKLSEKPVYIQALKRHMSTCLELACEDAVERLGVDAKALTGIVEMGFLFAHDKCCDDPECKKDVHKKLRGTTSLS
jgi:hypothetical protein